MSGRDREALTKVRDWSRSPPESPGVVGGPFPMSGSGREAHSMSGSVLQAFPEIGSCREAIPVVREWSGGHPGYPGGIGRPTRKSVSGRGALHRVRKWSGGFPENRGGREAIPKVCEWSGGHPGCPGGVGRPSRSPEVVWRLSRKLGVVGRPSRKSVIGREAIQHVREGSGGPPGCP